MIEKNKESQLQSITEFSQELKSLKALLLTRGTLASGPSTPVLPPKPTIPAWQLASSASPANSMKFGSGPAAPSPAPAPAPVESPVSVPNGKGKEVDLTPLSAPPVQEVGGSSSSS